MGTDEEDGHKTLEAIGAELDDADGPGPEGGAAASTARPGAESPQAKPLDTPKECSIARCTWTEAAANPTP